MQLRLRNDEHQHFLDMFVLLADRFGCNLPRGREILYHPPTPRSWQPLLTDNQGAGILYGYGDPAVLRVGAGEQTRHYLYVTSNDAPNAFPILRSDDLRAWRPCGFVFEAGNLPSWAATGTGASDFWAPEMHRIGPDNYLLAFCARAQDGQLSIGIARSHHPEGPFATGDQPLLRDGMIDPHVFMDEDGSVWLLWKEDNNGRWPALLAALLHARPELSELLFPDEGDTATAALAAAFWPWASTLGAMERFFLFQPLIEAVVERFEETRAALALHGGAQAGPILAAMRTPIYIQRLDPDAVALVGDRHILLVNDLAWEGHLIEGPWLTRRHGLYYLFYAGNDFATPDYGIGVAVSEGLLGPYRKQTEPLLRSSAGWIGPGHPSLADDAEGNPHLFFHAYRPGALGYKAFRAMLSARLRFDGERVDLLDGGDEQS